jgi:hypothetical protein
MRPWAIAGTMMILAVLLLRHACAANANLLHNKELYFSVMESKLYLLFIRSGLSQRSSE